MKTTGNPIPHLSSWHHVGDHKMNVCFWRCISCWITFLTLFSHKLLIKKKKNSKKILSPYFKGALSSLDPHSSWTTMCGIAHDVPWFPMLLSSICPYSYTPCPGENTEAEISKDSSFIQSGFELAFVSLELCDCGQDTWPLWASVSAPPPQPPAPVKDV